MIVRFLGNPDFKNEELISGELGYRMFVRSSLSIDASAFRGWYDGLTSAEPLAPELELTPVPHLVLASRFENLLDATSTGVELSAHWTPTNTWRVDGSYSAFRLVPRSEVESLDPRASGFDSNAPAHQWQLHSTLWLGPRAEVRASLFHVGRLEQLDVPAYTRADVRMQLKLSDKLSLIGTGYNLLDSTHREYTRDAIAMTGTLIPRSGGVQLSWSF